MEIINAFNHVVYRIIHNKDYSTLLASLDILFNSAKLKFRNYPIGERVGALRSTVGIIDNEAISRLPQMEELLEYIKKCIQDTNPDAGTKEIVMDRVWANRNYKNSSVRVHRHGNHLDGVCMFYIDVPDSDSGNLVVVNEVYDPSIAVNKKTLPEYNEDDKVYISINTGDVVLHSQKVYHGVSEYKSDNPRTTIIFDYYFK
jgi:hypothetical protein